MPVAEPASKPTVTKPTHTPSGKTDTKPNKDYLRTHAHYGKLGGRPKQVKPVDEAQAHDIVKHDWADLGSKLVRQACESVMTINR